MPTTFDALAPRRQNISTSSHQFTGAGRLSLPLFVAILGGLALIGLPLLALGILGFAPSDDNWWHLLINVLPDAAITTGWLMFGLALLTGGVGSTTAWIVTRYQFPARRFLSWALVLPLALPVYLTAFCYVELLDAVGPFQSGLRWVLSIQYARDLAFPEIRSLGGAILIIGLGLYPYTYLAARAALLLQSRKQIDSARTLGAAPWRVFLTIGLPSIRPALAIGILLALMEALNDIGAVEILGQRTMTYAVYETWLNRGSLPVAAQLSLMLLAIIILLIWIERRARGARGFASQITPASRHARVPLKGGKAFLAVLICSTPIVLGFFLPLAILVEPALNQLLDEPMQPIFQAALTSATLAGSVAVVTVGLGFMLAFGKRSINNTGVGRLIILSTSGYAVPGTVLAIGILIPLAAFDNLVDALARNWLGLSTGLLITGTGLTLVYAHSVRFMAIGYGTMEAGYQKLSLNLDYAGRSLGQSSAGVWQAVHFPLLRPVIMVAAILVFVESMKELSATLLLRPFNVETLSTLVYEAASRESFSEGALPALMIAMIGAGPILLLTRAAQADVEPAYRSPRKFI